MKRHALTLLALFVLGMASSAPAGAQTPLVNPRIVEFDPSADHSAVGADGQPLVQRYELRIFALGTTQPSSTADLGKPNPEADGKIRVDFSTKVSPWPPDGNYEARIAAVGPSGLGLSDPSNAFTLASGPVPACTYSLSAQNLALAAGGGTTSVTVTTGSTCSWDAVSNAAWATPAPGSGTGTATLSILVSANTGTAPRTATLTVAGQAVTITQAEVPCSFAVEPATLPAFAASGGIGAVNVETGIGCVWAASSDVAWASVTPGAGPGQATITVAQNSAAAARSTTLTVAGHPVAISQQAPAPVCSYSLTPTSISASPYGQTGSIAVSSAAGCAWTASTTSTWITLSAASGSGNGTVSFSVPRNSSKAPRTGTVAVGGQTCTISQVVPPAPSQPKKPRIK